MPDLLLTRDARDDLLAHARVGERRNREICGVLGGRRESGHETDGTDEKPTSRESAVRVSTVRRVPNVATTPDVEYELDPEATLAAIEEIETAGEQVLGFYHSHPAGPARPSATDRARATWPGYVYLIVVPGSDPEVAAWRWTNERFERLSIGITGEPA